jgi:uncharacterized protein (TIGR02588 family)
MADTKSESEGEQREEASGGLEWAVGLGSFVVVCALLGAVLFSAVTETSGMTGLSIQAGEPVRTGDVYVVPVEIRNDGDATAADLQISADLLHDGAPVDHARMQVDYVPAHSHSDGGLVFRVDPRSGELRLLLEGYRDP